MSWSESRSPEFKDKARREMGMNARLTRRRRARVMAGVLLCFLLVLVSGAPAAEPGTQMFAWGYNAGGGFGDCRFNDIPNALCGQTGVADVSVVTMPTALASIPDGVALGAGMFHSLAVRPDGSVWAWGMNGSGQLGSGGAAGAFSVVPVQVPGITDAVAVAGGWHQSHAIRSDGTLWSWGSAFTGLGGYSSNAPPTQVPGLSGVTSVAAGEGASFAVLSDGTLWSWGFNGSGLLGTGTFDSFAFSPVQVTALQDVSAVATHFVHALALKRDGSVWAWGNNSFRQLGDGTIIERRTPVQVQGLTTSSQSAWERSSASRCGMTAPSGHGEPTSPVASITRCPFRSLVYTTSPQSRSVASICSLARPMDPFGDGVETRSGSSDWGPRRASRLFPCRSPGSIP